MKKRRMSIDRIGMRGSIALLILGVFLLSLGIFFQIRAAQLPENTIQCSAVITEIEPPDDGSVAETTTVYVDYTLTVDGKQEPHTHVELGQYEAAWKIGTKLTVLVSSDDHEHIWTKTMQYRGIFYIIFAASPLLIAIYKIIQFRRIKGVNENETDIDHSGEEKFQLSSAIIPLIAGISFTAAGVFYLIIENSLLGLLIIILGSASIGVGLLSLFDFISYKIKKQ